MQSLKKAAGGLDWQCWRKTGLLRHLGTADPELKAPPAWSPFGHCLLLGAWFAIVQLTSFAKRSRFLQFDPNPLIFLIVQTASIVRAVKPN